MDNDDKIKLDNGEYSLHEEVMLFLGDEVNRIHQDVTNNFYNIEEEYAKTRKNHSPYNFFVLFGAFVVVIATVFFVNKYIAQKDQEIEVSLDEFEDLNLNNLLNTISIAQENYDNALKEKLILETEYETKLNNLKSDYENKIYILDSLNLSSKKEYNRRKSKIGVEYNNSVTEVRKEYDGKILLAQKQVDAYKSRLDEFDSTKVANAQEKEKLLNSERQLKQIEIAKLKQSYETQIQNMELAMKNMRSDNSSEMREAVHDVATRYQAEIDTLDPKLDDLKANEIMAALEETTDFDGVLLLEEARVHETAVIDSIKQYQDLYNSYKYLDDVVKSIPQKNSIPSYVAAARTLVNDMSKTYVDTSVGYYQDIVEKRQEIESLNQFINEQKFHYENVLEGAKSATTSYLSVIFKALRTDGIVLTVDDNDNIQIAVSPEVVDFITKDGVPAGIKLPVEMSKASKNKKNGIREEIISDFYIEGTIVPDVNGSYYFELAKDAEGNPIPVDLSFIGPGTNVEIIRETIN